MSLRSTELPGTKTIADGVTPEGWTRQPTAKGTADRQRRNAAKPEKLIQTIVVACGVAHLLFCTETEAATRNGESDERRRGQHPPSLGWRTDMNHHAVSVRSATRS